jgi:hypothetical protein
MDEILAAVLSVAGAVLGVALVFLAVFGLPMFGLWLLDRRAR